MVCESKCATCHSCSNSNSLIPTTLPSSLPFPSLLLPSQHCKSQEPQPTRTTTGWPPIYTTRKVVRAPALAFGLLTVVPCSVPQSKYHFPPLLSLANLLESSLTQALRAMLAPPSHTGSQAWCVLFPLSIQFPLTYSQSCHVTTSTSTA